MILSNVKEEARYGMQGGVLHMRSHVVDTCTHQINWQKNEDAFYLLSRIEERIVVRAGHPRQHIVSDRVLQIRVLYVEFTLLSE